MTGENCIKRLKRRIRKEAKTTWRTCPIWIVINGCFTPEFKGEPGYYTNRKGERIWYPNAYKRKGWNNMSYHPSTLRVEVGWEWIIENMTKAEFAAFSVLRMQHRNTMEVISLIGNFSFERKHAPDYVI